MNNGILAIDQGTTNTKVLFIDRSGQIQQSVAHPVRVFYPRSGWVEQDPFDLWESVVESSKKCLEKTGGRSVSGIAIANQRESVLIWNRSTGVPLGPVVLWQCRRTAPLCRRLREQGLEKEIHSLTGLGIDPLFSAGKIQWLLNQIPHGHERAAQGEICAGTVDSWLLWNFTGEKVHACDMSNASRTQLLNLETVSWDDRLLDIFGIPGPSLPEVLPSSCISGETKGVDGVPDGIPVACMIGDSHAALFGQGGFRSNLIKATYGTGSSVMSPTRELVLGSRKLSSTIAWGTKAEVAYALEGNITSAGATVQWLSELLGMKRPEASAELASETEDSGGIYIVPAFAGLGAPYWDETARGLITGITRGSSSSHFARAAIESIAFQIRDVFEVIEDEIGNHLDILLADGGGSRNDLLMQFQADILGRTLLRNNTPEITALGAAYLAGLELGFWSDPEELDMLPKSLDTFEPRMHEDVREKKYEGWKKAVSRVLFNPG